MVCILQNLHLVQFNQLEDDWQTQSVECKRQSKLIWNFYPRLKRWNQIWNHKHLLEIKTPVSFLKVKYFENLLSCFAFILRLHFFQTVKRWKQMVRFFLFFGKLKNELNNKSFYFALWLRKARKGVKQGKNNNGFPLHYSKQ